MSNQLPLDIRFHRLRPDAVIPTRGTPESTGLDLRIPTDGETIIVRCGEVSKIHTGLAVNGMTLADDISQRFPGIPMGVDINIRARSSIGAKGGIIVNAPGTIDADYTGELIVLMTALVDDITLEPGSKVAQLVVTPTFMVRATEGTGELRATQRGTGGFGSTGR